VADERPIDDDILDLIERMIRSRTEALAPRDPVERSVDRRGPDRRGLGFTARRKDDAELNRQRRCVLLDYFRRLSHDDLLTKVDGLWLGRATDAELAVLLDCAKNSGMPSPPPSRKRGRPRADQLSPLVPAILDTAMWVEWEELTIALTELSAARRRHRAPANQTRRGTPRSLEHRSACLASPIGQFVERAGLFSEFFDTRAAPGRGLTPQHMAARLLHRDHEQRLTASEAHAREQAAAAPSAQRRAYWQAKATKAAARRRQLASWKTLLNKLQQLRLKKLKQFARTNPKSPTR
jgi:hypothetical protein